MVIEKGYAKINLGLEVVGKREDGYHDLDMIMTTLSLYDELYFEDHPGKQIIIECKELEHVPTEENLIYKAIDLIRKRFGINRGIKVKVVKRIPERAGLGGGSADCAAALRAVNQLWELGLSLEQLAALGSELGSDVPFCIYNRTARVRGRGEVIEFIEDIPFTYLVLVIPPFRNSTAEVFRNFIVHRENRGKIEILVEAVKSGDLQRISESLFNDLEKGMAGTEIGEIKRDLLASGALQALMTGSGSAVYGLCLNNFKHAQAVAGRFQSLLNKKHPDPFRKYRVEICTTRSSRRAAKSEAEIDGASHKVTARTETKAYAMLPLAYQRIMNHYKTILTPLSLWSNLSIEILDGIHVEVKTSDGSANRELEVRLREIAEAIGSGLRVHIKKPDDDFGLISTDNYLSAVIKGLERLGYDGEKMYTLFPRRVMMHGDCGTVLYDSRKDEFRKLPDAVFGYVLLVDLKLNNYRSPRYTGQMDEPSRFKAIEEGLAEMNFYKMATNAYNSVEKFEERQIGEYKGKSFLERIRLMAYHQGATAAYLNLGGRTLTVICRFEKQAQRINNILKARFQLGDNLITSLKTDVLHQTAKSKVLKEVSPPSETYEDFDGSPFLNLEETEEYILDEERYRRGRKKKHAGNALGVQDCEGILLLNSGGSIFKKYDFIDIANYFQKFFEGKCITFELNGEEIPVEFKTECLPHILGIHLLDEKDPTLRGSAGFQRLVSGEIGYRELKKTGKVSEKTKKIILNKTQSSVMIFNDIFHNRTDNIYCFPRDLIVGSDTKMNKLEFGITRALTDNLFHKQNLLGIGKDEKTNKYFFYTSFIWNVPAHIGKKDSYRIVIS